MTAIIPIIITIGILVLLFFLLSCRAYAVIPRIFYGKRIRWTVIAYVVVLLIAMGTFYILPTSWSFGEVAEEGHSGWEVSKRIYEAAHNGKIVDKYSRYIEMEKEIKVGGESFGLQQINGESFSVFVDEKNKNDHLVDVTLYRTPTTIGNVTINVDLPPIKIDAGTNVMTFIIPEYPEVKLISYQKEFPITQFTDGTNWMHESIQRGRSFAYMEIPKGL